MLRSTIGVRVACKTSILATRVRVPDGATTTWGCRSNGRALALLARGTGIDAPHLQFMNEKKLKVL